MQSDKSRFKWLNIMNIANNRYFMNPPYPYATRNRNVKNSV